MLTVSEKAIAGFKELIEDEKGIRIFLVAGGWSPSWAMSMAQGTEKHDSVYEQDGLTFFLEREARKILMHATIDYETGQGFMITGIPSSSCCG